MNQQKVGKQSQNVTEDLTFHLPYIEFHVYIEVVCISFLTDYLQTNLHGIWTNKKYAELQDINK
jgi:hypothetical protein